MALPTHKNDILGFNQCMKSDKSPYIIYADIESLIKKVEEFAKQSTQIFNGQNGKTYSLRMFIVNYLAP